MEHDKLIEAMALSMANLDCRRFDCPELGSVDEFRYEDDYRDYMERATAALKALRDTLEPVGWMYKFKGQPVEATRLREARGDFSPWNWTETPLYALPRIEP